MTNPSEAEQAGFTPLWDEPIVMSDDYPRMKVVFAITGVAPHLDQYSIRPIESSVPWEPPSVISGREVARCRDVEYWSMFDL